MFLSVPGLAIGKSWDLKKNMKPRLVPNNTWSTVFFCLTELHNIHFLFGEAFFCLERKMFHDAAFTFSQVCRQGSPLFGTP